MSSILFDDSSDCDSELAHEELLCLFCDFTSPTSSSFLTHLIEHHSFNLVEVGKSLNLDFYGYMKLINYIRKTKTSPEEISLLDSKVLEDESLLTPVLQDDSLLFNIEEVLESADSFMLASDDHKPLTGHDQLLKRAEEAEKKAEMVIQSFKEIMGLDQKSSSEVSVTQQKKAEGEKEYFGSYSFHEIHEEMLKDKARTEAYRDSMMQNVKSFEGKIVLDIGCGTGILSMFAARAGAKHVYAIDASEMLHYAERIVQMNGLDNAITCIKGKVEEITLPVEKVDIIISEWMGYFLLFESMLPTVLFARDKWLVEGGLVLPNKATMYATLAEDPIFFEEHVDFWNDVYGFDMRVMKEWPLKELKDPMIKILPADNVTSAAAVIRAFDIPTMAEDEHDFTATVSLTATRTHICRSILTYFDVDFSQQLEHCVKLTTDPRSVPTHWKQTLFYLPSPLSLQEGEVITVEFAVKRKEEKPRHLHIVLSVGRPAAPSCPSFSVVYDLD